MMAVSGCRSTAPRSMCAIDMGSNSFRRIVGTFADGRYVETRHRVEDDGRRRRCREAWTDQRRQARGDRGRRCGTFMAACRQDGASAPVAVGTAAFRNAPNGARVIEIASRAGVRMEIASEQRESELAYLVGLARPRRLSRSIDNGSRSIELVAKAGGALQHRVFNLGYRIAYEEFFATAARSGGSDRCVSRPLAAETAEGAVHERPARAGRRGVHGDGGGPVRAGPGWTRLSAGRAAGSGLMRSPSQPADFDALKRTKDIDRALPRLVVAVDADGALRLHAS